jgi:hypothetical protein
MWQLLSTKSRTALAASMRHVRFKAREHVLRRLSCARDMFLIKEGLLIMEEPGASSVRLCFSSLLLVCVCVCVVLHASFFVNRLALPAII